VRVLAELVSEARILAAISEVRDLPACTPVIVQALSCLEDPDGTMSELKGLLMSDQAVAARILRLANSAYFGFRSEVHTVSRAVVLLGQDRIRTLLHRILLDRLLGELAYGQAVEIRGLSLTTATASCLLSQLWAREDAEQMLLAGLLHNIGELFCAARFPEQYGAVSRGQADPAMFGLRWERAGALLLEAWHLPRPYQAAAEFWLNPCACPPEHEAGVWQVHAARKLAEGHLSHSSPHEVLRTIAPPIRERCRLDQDLAEEILRILPERMSLVQLQAARESGLQYRIRHETLCAIS
jgi:HD-like signal output (HDOD) protein